MAKVQSRSLMSSGYFESSQRSHGDVRECAIGCSRRLKKGTAALLFLDKTWIHPPQWLHASWPDSCRIKAAAALSEKRKVAARKKKKLAPTTLSKSPIWQTLASYLQEANFSRRSSVVLTFHWSLAHLYFRGPKPGEGGRFEGRIPKASYFRANHSRVTRHVNGTQRRATENFW